MYFHIKDKIQTIQQLIFFTSDKKNQKSCELKFLNAKELEEHF